MHTRIVTLLFLEIATSACWVQNEECKTAFHHLCKIESAFIALKVFCVLAYNCEIEKNVMHNQPCTCILKTQKRMTPLFFLLITNR